MIIGFWGTMGSGMTLYATALAYRQFLEVRKTITAVGLSPFRPYKPLTREEFVREMEELEEGR